MWTIIASHRVFISILLVYSDAMVQVPWIYLRLQRLPANSGSSAESRFMCAQGSSAHVLPATAASAVTPSGTAPLWGGVPICGMGPLVPALEAPAEPATLPRETGWACLDLPPPGGPGQNLVRGHRDPWENEKPASESRRRPFFRDSLAQRDTPFLSG